MFCDTIGLRHGGGFEVIDGQQRTLSICRYVASEYSVAVGKERMYFHNFQDDQQKQILDYELMVYFCEGTASEKLDWFRTINIAGEELTDQELRNAVYAGPWTADAKRYFSKTGCPAYQTAGDYLKGTAIRQELLETAVAWHAGEQSVEAYMAAHQHDPTAVALWTHFQSVVSWAKATFPKYRKEMKGLPWGPLYAQFGQKLMDPKKLEAEVAALMADEDVSRRAGIYEYVLTRDERHLNLRGFADSVKRAAFERQTGVCVKCQKGFGLDGMEADHVTPWSEGGRTDAANCQMLCKDCNRRKSNR